MRAIALLAVLALACDDGPAPPEHCHDKAVLVATTAGSPNGYECTHAEHRIDVQVATFASPEEGAALVVCRCARDGGSP